MNTQTHLIIIKPPIDFFYNILTQNTELNKEFPYESPIESELMIDTEFEFQIAKLIIENKLWKS